MMSAKLIEGFSAQVMREYYSGYFYLQMAAWCDSNALSGMSAWFRVQAQEEMCHGLMFYNYLLERNANIKLAAIPAPPSEFSSGTDVFQKGLEHEYTVTASINALMDQAIADNDHASRSFLNWFVDEQVEEESNFSKVVDQLKLFGSDPKSLLMIDKELGTRVFALPAPLVGKV